MTTDGPRLIDWTGARRAPAAFDLACSHFVLGELSPQYVDNPQRPLTVNVAMQAEYARLTGVSQASLTSAIEPYLPIVHVGALLGGAVNAHRKQLIQRIEAGLSAQKG
jgi:hypothetical protein